MEMSHAFRIALIHVVNILSNWLLYKPYKLVGPTEWRGVQTLIIVKRYLSDGYASLYHNVLVIMICV